MPGSTGSDSGHTVPLEHITFDGQGSEDVTVFLQSVKRVALVQGRQRDDDWMVDYAEASLTGDALRWFSDLDEGTLRSWRTVRNAFLKRFTTPVARSARMSASTAPAPAASAAAPAAAPRMAVPQFSKLPKPNEVLGSILKGGNVYKALLVGKSGWLGYGWNNQSSPTEGVTYQMLLYSYSGVPWETHMWDSSGTMHCKTLASQYAATLDRVWIVYDVTDQSSFDSVRTWYRGVCRTPGAKQNLVALIGNKIDLVGRVISTQQGQALASEMGAYFFETSAKTNEGVQRLSWGSVPHFSNFSFN